MYTYANSFILLVVDGLNHRRQVLIVGGGMDGCMRGTFVLNNTLSSK
jgi:hypothetical protein